MQCLLGWKAVQGSWPRLGRAARAGQKGRCPRCADWLSKDIQPCPAGVCELLEMRRSEGCPCWLGNPRDPCALAEAPALDPGLGEWDLLWNAAGSPLCPFSGRWQGRIDFCHLPLCLARGDGCHCDGASLTSCHGHCQPPQGTRRGNTGGFSTSQPAAVPREPFGGAWLPWLQG